MTEGYTAVVIDLPDAKGRVRVRKVEVDGDDGLRFLQGAVGGYIEHIYSDDRTVDIWLNEEGKLNGLPINGVATEVLYLLNPIFRGEDVLVGNVVLTGNKGPETASVPAGLWEWLKALTWSIPVEFIDEVAA